MLRMRSVVFVLVVLVVGAGVSVVLGRGASEDVPVTEHPVGVPTTLRTVSVSATMSMPSAHPRRLSAMLEEGQMPRHPLRAEVLTDTDCAPDERMISRCRNVVRLSNGRRIVLRHAHDMRNVPCLAPGEQVLVVPAAA